MTRRSRTFKAVFDAKIAEAGSVLPTADGRGGSDGSRWIFNEFGLRRSGDDGMGDVALAQDGLRVGLKERKAIEGEMNEHLRADATRN